MTPGLSAKNGSPLAGTVARLADLDSEHVRLELGPRAGERWLDLDAVLAEGVLDLLFADAEARAAGRRDYLGASVAASLSDAVVTAGWPALLLDRRLPDLSPANLAVHRHEPEGWFDRIAVRDARCWVLSDDPAADNPDATTVADLAELHDRFAAAVVDAVTPWFTAVRQRAPFGRRGMWGQLADDLCGTALWMARRAGIDQHAAWAEAHAVLDRLAADVPEVRVRPRLFPVSWNQRDTLFQVKGTCCLWYKTQPAPDACGNGYCGTCPFRDDDARRSRLTSWLEEEAAAG